MFYVLAIHLATTIDRVKQGKKLKPQLSKIKRDYKEEFQIAWEMVKTIEKNFNVKLSGGRGRIYNYVFKNDKGRRKQN